MVVIAVPPVYPATVTLTLRAFGVVHGARTSGPTRAGASSSTPTGRSGKIPGMVRLEANHGPAAVDDHAWNPAWDLGSDFIPKERYTTRAFTELETHAALAPYLAGRVPRGGAGGARRLRRVPDRRPVDPRRARRRRRDPRLLQLVSSSRHTTRARVRGARRRPDHVSVPRLAVEPRRLVRVRARPRRVRPHVARHARRSGSASCAANDDGASSGSAPIPTRARSTSTSSPLPRVLRPVPPRGHAVPLVPHHRAARRTGRPRSTRSTRGTTTTARIRSCCSGPTTPPCATSSSPTVTPAT